MRAINRNDAYYLLLYHLSLGSSLFAGLGVWHSFDAHARITRFSGSFMENFSYRASKMNTSFGFWL